MAGRKKSPAQNKRQHHAAQVAKAPTRKQQLLAMGQWLTALAGDRGPTELEGAVALVWGRINELDPEAEAALEVAQQ
ncbi:hypothetical protein [Dactylosporangium salmoneum]|uniref:Uncharacterized protein n=1 Tax=Dactylosporangium salmoneum TaxID=53361 RepID=A0ABP5TCJ0_9ACTN